MDLLKLSAVCVTDTYDLLIFTTYRYKNPLRFLINEDFTFRERYFSEHTKIVYLGTLDRA